MEKNHIPVLPIVQITAQLSLVTLPDALVQLILGVMLLCNLFLGKKKRALNFEVEIFGMPSGLYIINFSCQNVCGILLGCGWDFTFHPFPQHKKIIVF